jgi:hypothetical protein
MKPTLKTYQDGTQYWYLNGELHREDGPAIIRPDGTQRWYLNGKCHREDGPAIIRQNGTKEWYINGKHHREDGPAIIYPDGTQEWFLNGNLHREDGPAYIGSNVYQQSWYINDINITKEVNNWANERNINLNNMSDEDKMILKTEIKMWK